MRNWSPLKLETDPIWKEANALAEIVYSKLHEIPEEEKWDTTAKLRTAANNLIFSVGEALGNASPSNREYDWGNVRQYASALKTMYRFAGRQKFIDLDPEIMVRLDKLIAAVDESVKNAYEQTAATDEKDLDKWREKYRLSRGENNEN